MGPSRHVPTGKRPTEEIVDYMGKVTLVPNLSCLFSTGTITISTLSIILIQYILFCS